MLTMTKKDNTKDRLIWPAIFIFGFVALVFAGYAGALIFFTWPIAELSLAKSGVFGDSFGALNALFSGLAFAGLIIAILYQREDLILQRNELRLMREEVQSQNFESTFFQMLRLHNDIVGAMRADYTRMADNGPYAVPVTSRDCFLEYERSLRVTLCGFGDCPQDIDGVRQGYDSFWRADQQALGHYFRYLYRVFKFIDEEGANEKHRYSGIAGAPLSDLELLLLYYNCLVPQGERFKPLAEEYALFDNLPIDLLFDKRHLSFVDPRAWGGQEGAVRKRLERLGPSKSVADGEARPGSADC